MWYVLEECCQWLSAYSHIGRIKSLRVAGKSLFFLDIEQEGHRLQIVSIAQEMNAFTGLAPIEFQRFYRLVRRGDIVREFSASNLMAEY
jgi:lysyl-tRNA synthetase class II